MKTKLLVELFRPDDKKHRATAKPHYIFYTSPLFGEMEAEVVEVRENDVLVKHPYYDCVALIPKDWIIGGLDAITHESGTEKE